MNSINACLVLSATLIVVFLQSTAVGFRNIVGAQPDLLPSLVVYATLTSGLGLGTVTALCGGLCFDALSHNPLGISIGPLFAVALVIERYRGLILRDQSYAQFITGVAAGAAAPALTLLLLLNTDRTPLVGWSSLWQWGMVALVSGVFTPAWFLLFGWLAGLLSYETMPDPATPSNRQIKRGRN
ncbi:MAG: hypothetical protein HYR88_12635 [Verrucomicrobia bacterium]|nr:hypothetical protein [Verrucomicrobiota bacterium]MBI3868175.1 hypothetical protein [Verrucomicrobiota bacterium]